MPSIIEELSDESVQVLDIVKSKPGVSIDEIMFATGLGYGNFVRAMYALDEHNLVSIAYTAMDADFLKFKVYPKVPAFNT